MTLCVIGRAPGDKYDHKIPIGRAYVGYTSTTVCGIEAMPVNNGDALYPFDADSEHACPTCQPRRMKPTPAPDGPTHREPKP